MVRSRHRPPSGQSRAPVILRSAVERQGCLVCDVAYVLGVQRVIKIVIDHNLFLPTLDPEQIEVVAGRDFLESVF